MQITIQRSGLNFGKNSETRSILSVKWNRQVLMDQGADASGSRKGRMKKAETENNDQPLQSHFLVRWEKDNKEPTPACFLVRMPAYMGRQASTIAILFFFRSDTHLGFGLMTIVLHSKVSCNICSVPLYKDSFFHLSKSTTHWTCLCATRGPNSGPTETQGDHSSVYVSLLIHFCPLPLLYTLELTALSHPVPFFLRKAGGGKTWWNLLFLRRFSEGTCSPCGHHLRRQKYGHT